MLACVCVCVCVCVCMCVHVRVRVRMRVCVCVATLKANNNKWHDMDPYDRLNYFYSFYKTTVVSIVSRRSLRNEVCNRKEPNKSKLVLYKLLLSL